MSTVPFNWFLTTLESVIDLRTGPFRSALHKSDYVIDGVPLINPSHIKSGKLHPDKTVSVSNEVQKTLSEYKLCPGDIVMG